MDEAKIDPPGALEPGLSAVPLFRGLGGPALAAIRQAGRRFTARPGEPLFHQDAPASALYLPLMGRVKLLQLSDDGQAVVLRVVEAGEPLGILSALQADAYPVSAYAVARCEGFRIPGGAFRLLMETHPRIALNALPVILGRLHRMQEQFRELATERVERRLARILLRLARQTGRRVEGGVGIGMPLTRQDLAEMAGTTLFTASRVLSRWEQAGLIAPGRKQLVIRSPHGLVAIAEDLPPGPPRQDD